MRICDTQESKPEWPPISYDDIYHFLGEDNVAFLTDTSDLKSEEDTFFGINSYKGMGVYFDIIYTRQGLMFLGIDQEQTQVKLHDPMETLCAHVNPKKIRVIDMFYYDNGEYIQHDIVEVTTEITRKFFMDKIYNQPNPRAVLNLV